MHSTTHNAPYIQPSHDSILELWRTFPNECIKVVRDPCQKITLLLLKSKSVRVIVPESCF